MKPIKEIYGKLAFEPVVGNHAVICCNDETLLFTSTVMEIRNATDSSIELETRNTVYQLTYDITVNTTV